MATAKAKGRTVFVAVPRGVDNDLKRIFRVTESVLGKLGCGGCHSGFDLRFITDPFIFNERGDFSSGPQG